MKIINVYDTVQLKDGTRACVVEIYGDQEVFDVDIGSSHADRGNITVKREDIIKVIR